MIMRYIIFITALVVVSAISSQAYAHPADGYTPKELPDKYGEDGWYTSDYDINEIYFICPFPDPNSLSDREKYMIAGVADGPAGTHMAWYMNIYSAVSSYYKKTGSIPSYFSAEMLMETASCGAGTEEITEDVLSVFRSPITGEYPKLNATSFSPGDLYIRPLTEAEKQFFASKDLFFKHIWLDGTLYCPETNRIERVQILDEPFYIRIYGETEVIFTYIQCSWRWVY
jgi:hypothetical protein